MAKGKGILISLGVIGVGVGTYFLGKHFGWWGKDKEEDISIDEVTENGSTSGVTMNGNNLFSSWKSESFALKKGMAGDKIKTVQRYLNGSPVCGQGGKIDPLKVDGKWGNKTQKAMETCYPDMASKGVDEATYNSIAGTSYAIA